MTTTTSTTKDTAPRPITHVWGPPARGTIPRIPSADLLNGRPAEHRQQIDLCNEAKAEADIEAAECRRLLNTAEGEHRKAIAEAIQTGAPLPTDPIPGIEARLAEATRMSEAYRLAATGHYLDLGDTLARTDAGTKSADVAARRVETLEGKAAKLVDQLSGVVADLATQRALSRWFAFATADRRPPKWAESSLGSKEATALRVMVNTLDLDESDGAA